MCARALDLNFQELGAERSGRVDLEGWPEDSHVSLHELFNLYTMIRKYLVFIPASKHRASKTLGIYWVKGQRGWSSALSNKVLVQLLVILCTVSPSSLLCPWDFPGKNTGVGCHPLLQGSKLPLLYCRPILYRLSRGIHKKPLSVIPEFMLMSNIKRCFSEGPLGQPRYGADHQKITCQEG